MRVDNTSQTQSVRSFDQQSKQVATQHVDRGAQVSLWQQACQFGVGVLALSSLSGASAQSFNTTTGAFANNGTGLPMGLPSSSNASRWELQQVQLRFSNGSLLPSRNCSIPPTYYRVPAGTSQEGGVCFRSGPSFAVKDSSTQKRVDTYEILEQLLWDEGVEPSLADFGQAFEVMFEKDQMGERLNRREYALAPAFQQDGLSCRYNQTTQRQNPDRCYSGYTIQPTVMDAFALGALKSSSSAFYGGVIKAGMDSLLDLSALAEAYSCVEDAQDCISYISYVGIKNAPGFPLRGLAATANNTDVTVYQSLVDAGEGLSCLRFRVPTLNFTEIDNLSLLQQQVNTGLNRLMAVRLAGLLSTWSEADDKSLVGSVAGDIWASTPFLLHRLGDQISAVFANQLLQTASAIGNFTLGGDTALPSSQQLDALIERLDNVVPCA